MTGTDYQQTSRRLSLGITVAYLLIVLAIAFMFFDRLSEVVDDLPRAGLISGVVFFAPLFLILLLARRKVTLRQDAAALQITVGRKADTIPRRSIDRIVVHEPGYGAIRLHSTDGALLATLSPPPRTYSRIARFLTDENGYVETHRQPVAGGRMVAITYMDGARP